MLTSITTLTVFPFLCYFGKASKARIQSLNVFLSLCFLAQLLCCVQKNLTTSTSLDNKNTW